MNRLTDHLFVFSFDCLSALDVPYLRDLPNFSAFIEKSSYCTSVETIYPSVTYPCHTTIVTGNFPNRHRIVNNKRVQPGRPSPDWYWHRRHIQGTTLYDEAKKAGMTTAALLWPVTAKAAIDYNLPEIFPNRPWHHQIPVSLMNGTPLFQIELNSKFGHLRRGISQPYLDDFVLESTVHTILTKKPGLLLAHFVDLDSMRHDHGFSSSEAYDALRRHDKRLGRLLSAIREAGLEDNSTVVLLGDHSQLDESKVIKPNVLFREHGLIKLNVSGKVADWKAFCNSCDGSAYIYVKDENDEETKQTVLTLLQEKGKGIEEIITGPEAALRGADGNALYMIEAERGYYFEEAIEGDYLEAVTKETAREKNYTFACHGYSPTKNDYETVFFAAGRGIRPGVKIPSMRLVDEGPTLARLIGVDLGDTDGHVIEELLIQELSNTKISN
ncbi:phosphodiesterase [Bacillus sp. FJAT-27225]|uniref:alkaline phosphatase family protein n=1 Tax=Bacillus sp. FJAT-27225 TaxID=1743144 RepID=UPI00080C20CD|nr:ectonucleotide pyrophosphatase/phosphodiesterase [Bacillus sp. FJAT-27225]OCA81608.1 phosphodiesterase [Bacillus sp. FJAT-27225]